MKASVVLVVLETGGGRKVSVSVDYTVLETEAAKTVSVTC